MHFFNHDLYMPFIYKFCSKNLAVYARIAGVKKTFVLLTLFFVQIYESSNYFNYEVPMFTQSRYQSYIDELQNVINSYKETYEKEFLWQDPNVSQASDLKNKIKAHEERIATLREIEKGQPISKASHKQLLAMQLLADDPSIAQYKDFLTEPNKSSSPSMTNGGV